MTERISLVEVQQLISAVNKEEELPKKKMEVLEDFMRRYSDVIATEGRRCLVNAIQGLSQL